MSKEETQLKERVKLLESEVNDLRDMNDTLIQENSALWILLDTLRKQING